jgi:hypothetical protein
MPLESLAPVCLLQVSLRDTLSDADEEGLASIACYVTG